MPINLIHDAPTADKAVFAQCDHAGPNNERDCAEPAIWLSHINSSGGFFCYAAACQAHVDEIHAEADELLAFMRDCLPGERWSKRLLWLTAEGTVGNSEVWS